MATIPEPFIRSSYSGLNEFEERMLPKYLRQVEGDIQRLQTQVHVGPGELLPESFRDSFRRSWRESSKFKIDAVVETDSAVQLVEIKDFIRTSHLGQLLSYHYWYGLERDPQKPLQLFAVAEDINPSAVQPTRFQGVEIVVTTPEGRDHFQQGLDAAPPFESPR